MALQKWPNFCRFECKRDAVLQRRCFAPLEVPLQLWRWYTTTDPSSKPSLQVLTTQRWLLALGSTSTLCSTKRCHTGSSRTPGERAGESKATTVCTEGTAPVGSTWWLALLLSPNSLSGPLDVWPTIPVPCLTQSVISMSYFNILMLFRRVNVH